MDTEIIYLALGLLGLCAFALIALVATRRIARRRKWRSKRPINVSVASRER